MPQHSSFLTPTTKSWIQLEPHPLQSFFNERLSPSLDSMPPVPGELVDLIISSLLPTTLEPRNEDVNYLDGSLAVVVGKCALVCMDWVPSSRRALFYRIHIRQDSVYGLAKLFNRPQRLTFLRFIRELNSGMALQSIAGCTHSRL
ncbi:hypothetical protein DFH09DRAFT_1275777 [Mycena vulgaris]|nr:hypothetical protein DFH09DRAFT_1275777 [Mycena vulgaris]